MKYSQEQKSRQGHWQKDSVEPPGLEVRKRETSDARKGVEHKEKKRNKSTGKEGEVHVPEHEGCKNEH